LYLYLSNKHGHLIGKTFSININGLLNSHPFHFGQRKMASAINFLLKSGYLKVVKKHQAGKHGRLFQLSKPVDVSVASLRWEKGLYLHMLANSADLAQFV